MINVKNIPDPLDGVDLESYQQIFSAPRKNDEGKLNVIKYKKDANGRETNELLNKITGEPYIGCGLVGTDLMENVLPPLYYNAKVQKPVALVGPSGTGKTSIAECHIMNFHNVDWETLKTKDDEKIIGMKTIPILRVQNTPNIQKEEIVGEWNILAMIFAEPGAKLFTRDFFTVRNMSKALEKGEGKGVLLDEVTRSPEEVMSFYLQPTRERRVTTEGLCFGECIPGQERKRFYSVSTENEGDAGTIDKPSALQTRFSRVPVDFISAEDEANLVKDLLLTVTEDQGAIELIASSYSASANIGIVPCLTQAFRGKGNNAKLLTVAPSIGDTRDLSRMFVSMGVTKNNIRNKKMQNMMSRVALTVLGKNENDAPIVENALKSGMCGIKLAAEA